MINYITVNQAAEKWKISSRRVQVLCAEGRIKGTVKMANAWFIPEDAEKPKDMRKSNKKMGGE